MGEKAEEVSQIWNTEERLGSFLELAAMRQHVTSRQIIHLFGDTPKSNFGKGMR